MVARTKVFDRFLESPMAGHPLRRQPGQAMRLDEHFAIIDLWPNPERRRLYELLWHIGGAQTNVASLTTAESVDWQNRVISSYRRLESKSVCRLHFGNDVAAMLEGLPREGPPVSQVPAGATAKKAQVNLPTLEEYERRTTTRSPPNAPRTGELSRGHLRTADRSPQTAVARDASRGDADNHNGSAIRQGHGPTAKLDSAGETVQF